MDFLDFLWVLGYLLVVLAGLYRYFVSDFDFFLDQAVPGPEPVPIFGSWWKQWNKKFPEVQLERYQKYGRVFGVFDGRKPNLYVGEPKLLRKILVTDFDNFVNRVPTVDMKNKYASNMLISLNSYKWKDTKNALTPVFANEKLAKVSELMNECIHNLIKHMNETLDRRFRKMDLRKAMTTFSLEVVANCGFGIKIDSLGNPNDAFVKNATTLFNYDGLKQNAVTLLIELYPSLGKFIPSRMFKEVHFFAKTARVMLEQRRKEKLTEKRNDFLDILLESHSDSSIVMNPLRDEIVLTAQILQLLLAGTDTTSSVLTYLLYNLTLREDIQEKVRSEVVTATKDGISYESITKLPYLEQCIAETLRLHPPVLSIDRRCNKTIVLGGIRIEKGMHVTVPVYAIHQDPEFYPDPKLFDPERFSEEEKNKRDPMTYLPFGMGPRSCMGSQFADVEMKIVLCHLLTQFRFKRTLETPEILEFLPGTIPVYRTGKILVNFERINA